MAPDATTNDSTAETGVSIGEASARTGVSADALRYYERIGVLAPVPRDAGGRRRYDAATIGMIDFVRRLRSTGMGVEDVAAYAGLVRRGEGTVAERRAVLERHRDHVAAQVEALAEVLSVLDRKIGHYADVEKGAALDCDD
ncbi:MAG: MerR family transcriptional regulator [Acidimicrobiales bacterium]